MAETFKLARPFLVMLAIVATGRMLQGVFGVPYAKGHHVFSIATLTVFSCLYYGIFLRRWRSARLMQAILVGFTLGLLGQIVIFVLTLASYLLGVETYFNHPVALNATDPTQAVPFAAAIYNRLGGLVGNSIFAGIAGALGWTLGALLPEHGPETGPAGRVSGSRS